MNGKTILNGVGLQDKAQFECFEGFQLNGPYELICNKNEVSDLYVKILDQINLCSNLFYLKC